KGFLEELWNESKPSEASNYLMNPEFEYVYLLLHLHRHLKQTGIGIRSLLDLAIFKEKNTFDEAKLNQYLIDSNMNGFNEKVNHINSMILNQKPVDETAQKMIEYIIKSGIH